MTAFNPINLTTNTHFPGYFSADALLETVNKFLRTEKSPANQKLIVKDMSRLPVPVECEPNASKIFGFPVQISKSLPETVKDADGNEVELIGLLCSEMTSEDFQRIMETGKILENRIVMITGKIVKPKP